MKSTIIVCLLFAITSICNSQTTKTTTNKIYSFTGKKIEQSVITAGVDYTPPAKVKMMATKMGVSEVKFKKIEANDVVAVLNASQKLICIPNALATKLEANDLSAMTMVAFAFACQTNNSEAATKVFVKQADKKAIKYMKENFNATLADIKTPYNKILSTSELTDYPTKEERLKIVEQMFAEKPETNNTPDNSEGTNSGNTGGNNGNTNTGNEGGNNTANCQINKTGTVAMTNTSTNKITIIVFKGNTLEGDEYMPITIDPGKTSYLYEVSEGIHAWKDTYHSGKTGQINLSKCQTETITW